MIFIGDVNFMFNLAQIILFFNLFKQPDNRIFHVLNGLINIFLNRKPISILKGN